MCARSRVIAAARKYPSECPMPDGSRSNWPWYGRLAAAVAAVSCAAPLIKLTTAEPVTVAFWRVFLAAAGAWLFVAILPRRGQPTRTGVWIWIAGILLGLHFWTWITSLSYTSVANSVLLVTTQPIWAAFLGLLFLGERVPPMGWLGIGLALAGCAGTIGYEGVQLRGDLLAVAGAILAAAYLVVGRRERQVWDAVPYLARVYGAAAVTLAGIAGITGAPLLPAQTNDFWVFGALAAIPTGIGHSLYNVVLKHLPAYVVATAVTGEPVGASVLAYWWIGEAPPVRTLLMAPLILAGILVVGWSRSRWAASETVFSDSS
jgi:drug/metabolite transporter (DMT)-like permease